MLDQDAEEWRIDCLLLEMNIHLPDIPQDEGETSEFPALKDREFQELIDRLELIDGLSEQLPRDEAEA